MWCFEYEMAGAIDHTSLASGRASPEEEDDVVTAAVDRLDDSIGEGLPAEALMARCHTGADGEGGVEEEDSLLRPMAGGARQGWIEGWPRSEAISFLMLMRLGGMGTPLARRRLSPRLALHRGRGLDLR